MAPVCPDGQVDFRYNINGNLFNRAKSKHLNTCDSDAEFADDAVIVVPLCDAALCALETFHTVATASSLTVKFAKT